MVWRIFASPSISTMGEMISHISGCEVKFAPLAGRTLNSSSKYIPNEKLYYLCKGESQIRRRTHSRARFNFPLLAIAFRHAVPEKLALAPTLPQPCYRFFFIFLLLPQRGPSRCSFSAGLRHRMDRKKALWRGCCIQTQRKSGHKRRKLVSGSLPLR